MVNLSDEIMAILKADPTWVNLGWEPFYRRLPQVLAGDLQNQVTLNEVLWGNLQWVKFLLEEHAHTKVYKFLNKRELESLHELVGDPAQRMYDHLVTAKTTLSLVVQGRVKFVTSHKEERSVLIEYGLTGAALRLYDIGLLSMRGLLRTRPLVVAPTY